jgi:hypothetical protein
VALPAIMLDYVCRAAEELGGGSACAAGYPDLLVTKAQLASLLGPERAARVPMRADSREILAWHGVKQSFEGVFDARAAFAQQGFTLDVVDIVAARGDEIILDLNRPLPHGFEIHLLVGISNIVLAPKFFELPPYANFSSVPDKTVAVLVAQRIADVEPIVPTQRKYVESPDLKASVG